MEGVVVIVMNLIIIETIVDSIQLCTTDRNAKPLPSSSNLIEILAFSSPIIQGNKPFLHIYLLISSSVQFSMQKESFFWLIGSK